MVSQALVRKTIAYSIGESYKNDLLKKRCPESAFEHARSVYSYPCYCHSNAL